MGKYKVSFRLFGTLDKSEVVEAETLFKAEKVIQEKYGKENVKVSVIASLKNEWC